MLPLSLYPSSILRTAALSAHRVLLAKPFVTKRRVVSVQSKALEAKAVFGGPLHLPAGAVHSPPPPLASPPFPAPRHRGFLSPLFVLHLLPHLHATLAPCLVSNPFVQHLLGTLDLCSLSVKVSLGLSVSLCLFLSISICHAPFPPPGRGNMSLTACFPIRQLVHVVALCVSLVDFYDQTCTPPAKVTVEVQY